MYSLQEREFSKSADTDSYQLFEGDKVFVIWEWEWLEDHRDPKATKVKMTRKWMKMILMSQVEITIIKRPKMKRIRIKFQPSHI